MTQISEEHQISRLKLILRYWPSGLVLPCDSTRQRDAKLPENVPDESGTIKSIRTCRSPDIRLTLMLQSQTHHAAVKTGRNEAYRLIHCFLQYCNIRFQLRDQFFMLSNLCFNLLLLFPLFLNKLPFQQLPVVKPGDGQFILLLCLLYLLDQVCIPFSNP